MPGDRVRCIGRLIRVAFVALMSSKQTDGAYPQSKGSITCQLGSTTSGMVIPQREDTKTALLYTYSNTTVYHPALLGRRILVAYAIHRI